MKIDPLSLSSSSAAAAPTDGTAPAAPAAPAPAAPAAASNGGGNGGEGKKKKEKQPKQPKGGGAKPAEEEPDPGNPNCLNIVVGRIVKAWPHPDSEKLFCEEIDIGEAVRAFVNVHVGSWVERASFRAPDTAPHSSTNHSPDPSTHPPTDTTGAPPDRLRAATVLRQRLGPRGYVDMPILMLCTCIPPSAAASTYYPKPSRHHLPTTNNNNPRHHQ